MRLIHGEGGVAIAAHVDRKSFGVFSQLGFFPQTAGFDGLEVSKWLPADSPRLAEFAALGLPLVSSSDSHYLEEIGAVCTELVLLEPTFAELVLAFEGTAGRGANRVDRATGSERNVGGGMGPGAETGRGTETGRGHA